MNNRGSTARIANIILGVWLFLSAFLWIHSSGQQTNTWLMGLIAVGAALVALYRAPQARYVNSIVGLWLVLSAWLIPTINMATVWNNIIVGVLMFGISLVPNVTMGRTRPLHPRGATT